MSKTQKTLLQTEWKEDADIAVAMKNSQKSKQLHIKHFFSNDIHHFSQHLLYHHLISILDKSSELLCVSLLIKLNLCVVALKKEATFFSNDIHHFSQHLLCHHLISILDKSSELLCVLLLIKLNLYVVAL